MSHLLTRLLGGMNTIRTCSFRLKSKAAILQDTAFQGWEAQPLWGERGVLEGPLKGPLEGLPEAGELALYGTAAVALVPLWTRHQLTRPEPEPGITSRQNQYGGQEH